MPTSPEATWTRVSPATSPPVRDSASMAYDSATGSVVLFGGANGGSDLNDTWTFNGVTWTRLSPSTSPPARAYASMAYDPATGKIVLFGGSGNSGDLSDTWTFDGTNWTELSTTARPPARDSASFAYDAATGKIVLFGGEGNGGNLGDTWTFDGTNWTQLSPPASPPARWYSAMAYDPATADVVLFGGSGNGGDLSDTWTFDGTTWTELSTATRPPARDSASIAYDPTTGHLIMFGGEASSGDLSDTWTFDGTNWTQVTTASSPTARDGATMAYDLATSGVVLFGGEADSVSLSDTWTFAQITVVLSQASPTAATVAYGAGYGGHLAVTNAAGTVSYIEARTDATDVIVSGSGAIRAATSLAPGTYTVTGRDSDTNGDIGSWTFSLTVGKASQTVVFTSTAPSDATVGTDYVVKATGGASGNEVTFSTTSICTVSGSTVSFIGAGECVVDANQAGDAHYLPASEAQQTIAVGKASQVITFISTAPSDATVGGIYTVRATGGASDNALIFSATSMCAVAGAMVHFIGAGRCVVNANQSGNANYFPAIQVEQTIIVGRARQTIAFTSRAPADASVGATYTVRAVGGASGHKVIFRTRSRCIVSGSVVRFTGVGICTINANQAGDADYLPATEATQSFRVAKASSKTALRLSSKEVTYGNEQVERLSVTVFPQYVGTPTGRVTIKESGTTLCAMVLSSDKRTCTLSRRELTKGTHHLAATYLGSTNFKRSSSAREVLIVIK